MFFEHVVDPNEASTRRWAQETVAPVWRIIADGCGFLDIARVLNEELGDAFDLHIDAFEAPFPAPLSFIKPHVRGVAVKR